MKIKDTTREYLGWLLAAVICGAVLGMCFGSAKAQEAPQGVEERAVKVKAATTEFLDALQVGDAPRAFGVVTLTGKAAFTDASGLARFVAEHWPMLIAAKANVAGKSFMAKGALIQSAVVVDAFNGAWLVFLIVEEEPDGWKVAGLVVTEAADASQPL